MKTNGRRIINVFPGLALLASWPAAGAELSAVPVLPASQWTVQAAPGDTVELADKEGCLGISFTVAIKKQEKGWMSRNQGMFRLLLKNPMPLTDDQERVIFEASGLEVEREGRYRLALLPIVRDASGELLIYQPWAYPHLKSGSKNWSRWMSRTFYTSEAGGATQNVLEPEGGDGNGFPNGALSFVGFEVRAVSEDNTRQGILYLGSIGIGGMMLPSGEPPFIFADSLLKEAGEYRLGFQVANSFQGLPIRDWTAPLKFDPADQNSLRQRIEIPLGPDGQYWIRYQAADASGRVVAEDSFRSQVEGSPKAALPPAVDPKRPPSLGRMIVNPERGGNGVYKADEAMRVTVRVFPKDAKALKLAWRVQPYRFATILEEGKRDLKFTSNDGQDVAINVARQPGRDAYRIELSVLDGDKVVDKQSYLLGSVTDLSKPYANRAGREWDREKVKQTAYFRVSFDDRTAKSEDEVLAQFRTYLENASALAPNTTYAIDTAQFEVLPGVYDFAMLDRMMDLAADYAMSMTIRFSHIDQACRFAWQPYSLQRNFDGTELHGHPFYGAYAVSDERFLDCWERSYKALHDRYRTHAAFQGYLVYQIGGEMTTLDRPWLGETAGYEACNIPAFRKYLQDSLKLDLPGLNKRWSANFKSWDEVRPPLPDFRTGTRPDLRVSWMDFCRFKDELAGSWNRRAVRGIRAYDPRRVITIFGGQEDLCGEVDYFHNGGSHFLEYSGALRGPWAKGTGTLTEPHHPTRWAAYGPWILDISTFVMFAEAGGGGMNIHLYFGENSQELLPLFGGRYAYDRMEKLKPLWRELHTAVVLDPPAEVATLRDPVTLYCKHRTTFGSRRDDLCRWHALLKTDSITSEPLRPDRKEPYKLLMPNLLDEVMSLENIDTLDRLVRGGAKMIISANTGSYSPELGTEPFQFLKKLGIAPPKGAYEQLETEVEAKAVADGPLFAKDASLKFFTLGQMRREVSDPKLLGRFFDWPFKWISETDYFGYYKENRVADGTELARFASGATAVSLLKVGNGEVIVFWGIPNYRPDYYRGMMVRAAAWAGVNDPRRGSPIPHALEARSESLKRNYALFYQDKPGEYTQKLTATPDGEFFLDELVSDEKLGVYTGKELRENGLPLKFEKGFSPLKVIRLLPKSQASDWGSWNLFRMPAAQE
jgi:hypothetical protein